jgi:hypothetical protein
MQLAAFKKNPASKLQNMVLEGRGNFGSDCGEMGLM